jgi:hypothetical protein
LRMLGRPPKNMLSISFNNCAGNVFERAYSLSTLDKYPTGVY